MNRLNLLSNRTKRVDVVVDCLSCSERGEKREKEWREYEPLKLHLGCGKRYLKGWYHIDAIDHPNVQMVADVSKLDTFPDGVADEIYASHILEHINRHQVVNVLKEWKRILKPNGILRIAVPNFEAVVEHYNEHKNLSVIMGLLYGGQDSALNYHYVTFDFAILKAILEEIGFRGIAKYDHRDFLPEGYDDFSRCYLPHLDETNGKLMSLNVVGYANP